MDVRQLQAFLRIAELGSFARAVAVLNQTQPTLSRQIAALEAEVGAPLLARHRHGVTLTDAGVLFRARAVQALRVLEEARGEISAHAQAPSGTVSLGLPPSLLTVMSGPLVQRFARDYPGVLLHVHEAISQGLEDMMRSGAADLAVLIADRRVLRNVTLTPLASEPLMLAGPRSSGLRADRPVAIERLAGQPLLTFRPPNYLRLLAETALRKRGLAFNVAVELETLPLMIDLIERGAGYTLLPPSGLALARSRIAAAPVRGLDVTWTLAVNRARAGQPAVTALAAMIREHANALTKSGHWQSVKPARRR
ncbi:MAG: LysR family transcriptional regulator [Xanthobacteraceae bacterium]|uniref:LysR family transcriptional regulator n=1 Tax=Pseudolabrys sp. TaxID=1960880 RepID=UPI003D0FA541